MNMNNNIRYSFKALFSLQAKYIYALPVIELCLMQYKRCSHYILHDNKCKIGRKCQRKSYMDAIHIMGLLAIRIRT